MFWYRAVSAGSLYLGYGYDKRVDGWLNIYSKGLWYLYGSAGKTSDFMVTISIFSVNDIRQQIQYQIGYVTGFSQKFPLFKMLSHMIEPQSWNSMIWTNIFFILHWNILLHNEGFNCALVFEILKYSYSWFVNCVTVLWLLFIIIISKWRFTFIHIKGDHKTCMNLHVEPQAKELTAKYYLQ